MHIQPQVILDGEDVSRYFISCHCEMTANSTKDPGKYDLTLSNAGGRFLGMFALKNIEDVDREQMGLNDNPDPVNFHLAPKKKVSLKVTVSGKGVSQGPGPSQSSRERSRRRKQTSYMCGSRGAAPKAA